MNEFSRKNVGRKAALIMFCMMMMMSNVSAFVSHATRGGLCGTGSSQFIGRKMQIGGMPQRNSNRRKKTTELKMLLGSDAGVFGVGAPEIVSRYLQNALPFFIQLGLMSYSIIVVKLSRLYFHSTRLRKFQL